MPLWWRWRATNPTSELGPSAPTSNESTTHMSRLHDKIKALLNKTTSNGCTEAEAMAALALAQRLMDEYEIPASELESAAAEEAIVHRTNGIQKKDPHGIIAAIITPVCRFCGTRVWRDQTRRETARRSSLYEFEICGLRSDIDLSFFLILSLKQFIEGEATNALLEGDASDIPSFVAGCAKRIRERLSELTAASTPQGGMNALVPIRDAAIRAKMNALGIRLSTRRGHTQSYDPTSFAAGSAAGDRASFGRPVGGALRLGRPQ